MVGKKAFHSLCGTGIYSANSFDCVLGSFSSNVERETNHIFPSRSSPLKRVVGEQRALGTSNESEIHPVYLSRSRSEPGRHVFIRNRTFRFTAIRGTSTELTLLKQQVKMRGVGEAQEDGHI